MFTALLRCLRRDSKSNRQSRVRHKVHRTSTALRRSFVPRLDVLEDRIVLSTLLVENLADSGSGSLRQAILDANATPGDDTITFDVTGAINLASNLPSLSTTIDIQGPGSGVLTVWRGSFGSVFRVVSGGTVTISGLTIRDSAYGITNEFGALTVNNSIISDNYHAGIHNYNGTLIVNNTTIFNRSPTYDSSYNIVNSTNGTAIVNNSTIRGRLAFPWGIGILNTQATLTVNGSTISNLTQGIYNYSGTLTVNSSTISGNGDSAVAGGGIVNLEGALTVNNSTISGNTGDEAEYGGGITSYGGPLHLHNTILAGNTLIGSGSVGQDLFGSLTTSGYNLIGNPAGGSGYASTDILGVAPLLGPLQDNGGPTFTHALLPGSPAVDAGNPNFAPPPSTDQRGLPRVVTGHIDIGAYELQPPPQVGSFSATLTGFTAQFSRLIDASVLNLYDTQTAGLGPTDVVIAGAGAGPVTGSLVVDCAANRFTFVRTGSALPPDTYTVRLRSAANGFRGTDGVLLDGDYDGIPGGDYVATFTVAPSTARVVSIPDLTRGPGQPVNVPADGTGLPLRLSNGAGVRFVTVEISFDPALLRLTGTTSPWAALTPLGEGRVRLSYSGPALPAGDAEVARLTAVVPADAPYGAKQVLRLSSLSVQSVAGPIVARAEDALHLVGYFGDTSGNAGYSSADATRALRVAVGLDSGFDAYPLTDPALIADITGNGTINATDATRILQETVGLDRPEIPSLPPNPPTIVRVGPDPFLNLPTHFQAAPGEVVTVPVLLDLSDGLENTDLAISFDPTRLEVVKVQRGDLTDDFDLFAVNLDALDGTLWVGLGRSAGPIADRGSSSVIEITFRVRENASPGPTILNLRQRLGQLTTQLNEGGLDLIPDPSDEEGDVLDGQIMVLDKGNKPLPPWDNGRGVKETSQTDLTDAVFAMLAGRQRRDTILHKT